MTQQFPIEHNGFENDLFYLVKTQEVAILETSKDSAIFNLLSLVVIPLLLDIRQCLMQLATVPPRKV